MGSSFKANKSQNLINTKLIPACEFDAYFFKIMFHLLGTEGLIFSSFCHQVLHKSDFFLVVGSPGSIKRIFVIVLLRKQGLFFHSETPFSLKPWKILGNQLVFNERRSLEMGNRDNL